jgi:tetratricopeptide (TPR) repeat protein
MSTRAHRESANPPHQFNRSCPASIQITSHHSTIVEPRSQASTLQGKPVFEINLYERKKILGEARQLFKEKAYPDALQRCKILLDQGPPQVDVLALQALIQQQSGNLEDAGKSVEQALGLSPDHPGMLFTAALINNRLENSNLALKQAMKAARVAPDDPKVVCQCALIIGSLGEQETALRSLETLIRKHPDHAEAWHLMGKFQKELGNTDAAEFALRRCLALQPDHAGARGLL